MKLIEQPLWKPPLWFSVGLSILALLTIIHSFPIWYATRWIFLATAFLMIMLGVLVIKQWRKKKAVSVLTALSYLLLFTFSLAMFAVTTVKIGQYGMMPKTEKTVSNRSENGFIDYRGQIHVHSYLSHDASSSSTFEKIAKAAKSAGVSWIILTDHIHTLPPGEYPEEVDGVIFIYGAENSWKKEKSSIFVASLKDSEPRLNMHGHIEDFGWSGDSEWHSWDAIEIVNFHANSLKKPWTILWRALFDPKHIYQVLTDILPKNYAYWQSLAEREQRPIPIFAGPDAHQNVGILGVQVDPYDLMLSLVSTHIWIPENEPLNQDSIFTAVKNGRTYVAFDYLGDPTGFQFWAEYDYEEKFFTGETVLQPHKLVVKNPSPFDTEVRMIWNNQETWFASEIKEPQPGFWRVEIRKSGNPWIISGQILVK